MKRTLSILAAICILAPSCKKKRQPGSPYTKQLAGTRTFIHVDYRSISAPSYTPVTVTDTVPATITYVDDATILFDQTKLIYNAEGSNDSVCLYRNNDQDYPSSTISLSYDHVHNSILFRSSTHISAAGNFWTTYASL